MGSSTCLPGNPIGLGGGNTQGVGGLLHIELQQFRGHGCGTDRQTACGIEISVGDRLFRCHAEPCPNLIAQNVSFDDIFSS